jgi:membrane-associated protease RseP (regulator of RpoE activity)
MDMGRFRTLLMAAAINAFCVDVSSAQDLLGATVTDSMLNPKGAFLNVITPGGSAARAGLLGGDIITAVDGKPVSNATMLTKALAAHRAGDKVAIDAVHLGKPGHFTLELAPGAAKPQMAAAAPAAGANVAAPAQMRWTTFADPNEHAFTAEVPVGWRVSGGTYRKNPIDIPLAIQAVSPDGQITVFYSDPNLPVYSVPNAGTAIGGFRQGSVFPIGPGVQTILMPYMDGQTFAARWGLTRISQACPSAKLMGSRPRNDTTTAMDQIYANGGIRTSLNAGEASFSCNLNGKEAGGYVFAATELVQTPSTQIWDIKYLVGIIAPAAQAATAYAVLDHMANTYAIDKNWLARQAGVSQQFDQIVAQSNAAVSQRIADNGRAVQAQLNQASQNLIQSGMHNADETYNANESYDYFAVRGTSDFADPQTGTTYGSIDNSYAHTYANDSGQILNTNSENSPGAGWHPLQRLPAGQ